MTDRPELHPPHLYVPQGQIPAPANVNEPVLRLVDFEPQRPMQGQATSRSASLRVVCDLPDRQRVDHMGSQARITELNKQRREIENKLDRLYTDRAEGIAKDTETFRRKIADYETQLESVTRAIAGAKAPASPAKDLLTPKNLEIFSNAIREKLRGEQPGLRKAYVRRFVDRIDVKPDEIRITGSKAELYAALETPTGDGLGPVPGSVQEWWAQ